MGGEGGAAGGGLIYQNYKGRRVDLNCSGSRS